MKPNHIKPGKKILVFIALFFSLNAVHAQAPGNAYYFNDNDSGYTNIANPHENNKPGPFDSLRTVEAWVRPDWVKNAPASDPYLFSLIDWWGVRWGITMGKDYGSIGVHGNGDTWPLYKFQQGHWYHIACVINDDSTTTVYVNGRIIGTSTAKMNSSVTGTPFKLGIDYAWNNGNGGNANHKFKGGMDEVRIWKTARTQAQIQADMYNEIDPTSAGLWAYYRFDQSSGTTLPDLTGNGYDGEMDYWHDNQNNPAISPTWVESYAMVMPKVAAPTDITGTSFTVNWAAPEAGTVENYFLDVSADSNFVTYELGYEQLNVGTATSYNVTGLSEHTKYYYRVAANKATVANQGGFSAIDSAATSSALAVHLVSFTALHQGKLNLLNWATATEMNNSGFEVQRSADGIKFIDMAFVPTQAPTGNSNARLNYSFSDNNILAGNNYYRLKQIDNDKNITYSNTVVAQSATSRFALQNVYPNPARSQITLTNMQGVISVYDAAGRLILSKTATEAATTLNIRSLSPGVYFIKDSEGDKANFIKQ